VHVIFTGVTAQMMVLCGVQDDLFFTSPVDGFLKKAKPVTINHQI
jgi:hypothetical protein